MRFPIRLAAAGWAAAVLSGTVLPALADAAGDCKLGKIAELPVTMVDQHPMVMGSINGTDASFIADSGAFYSMLTVASAAQLHLNTYAAPWGLRVTGVGGEAAGVSATRVKEFRLAGVPIPLHGLEFLVGGGDVGGGGVGVLGQNVFQIGDVEYDLANGVIRLVHEEGCTNANLAYWANGQTFSMVSIEHTSPRSPHTTGSASINGVKIRVMFDTGASTSVLSERAAERAGVKVGSPGVVEAGYSRGVGKEMVKTWVAPFASFKIGDEEIRNTRLRIGATVSDDTDMLIGADFFLSHRVYVASKLHRLFFTYNGGPVFNLEAKAAAPPAPAASEAGADAAAATPAAVPPLAAGDEGRDAGYFSRRGSAYAARRDFEHAVADLTRACELAPGNPDYFYERALAELGNRQQGAALADFDRAIELKPDDVPALVARGQLRLAGGNTESGIEDFDKADRAAAKEADARLALGIGYARADQLPKALGQLDDWIGAHAEDARQVDALSERCWLRALGGVELKGALSDCNAALKRVDAASAAASHLLDARGLVRLRGAEYDKADADFGASLRLRPRDAWALYGRGLVAARRGRAADGETDMAAATASWPPIIDQFKKRGLAP